MSNKECPPSPLLLRPLNFIRLRLIFLVPNILYFLSFSKQRNSNNNTCVLLDFLCGFSLLLGGYNLFILVNTSFIFNIFVCYIILIFRRVLISIPFDELFQSVTSIGLLYKGPIKFFKHITPFQLISLTDLIQSQLLI